MATHSPKLHEHCREHIFGHHVRVGPAHHLQAIGVWPQAVRLWIRVPTPLLSSFAFEAY
jgi:hypothetical protein